MCIRDSGGGDHGVRRQPVHLGLVEQQEDRPGAADAVVGVRAVESRLGIPQLVQGGHAVGGSAPQLLQVPELDGRGRAGLRARRGGAHPKPVVAEGALGGDADLGAGGRARARPGPGDPADGPLAGLLPAFDDPEGAGRHACLLYTSRCV